jgi:tetratricopeptide (TPR) repeat protein
MILTKTRRASTNVFLFLIISVATVCLGCDRSQTDLTMRAWSKPVPDRHNALILKISALEKAGNFDEAVSLTTKALENRPTDDLLLQELANVYFLRAQHDTNRREEFVRIALDYSERALAANPDDLVNSYVLAEDYETAGMNLGESKKSCILYGKSLHILELLKNNTILEKPSAKIGSEFVATAPYKKRLAAKISEVQSLAARCK